MGWEFVSRRFATELADFVTKSGTRWSDALKKISAGTYTSTEFKNDVGDSVSGSIDVWTTLLSSPSTELLPVARLEGTAADIKDPLGLDAVVEPEEPIAAGAALEPSSTLVMEGNASKQIDCSLKDSGGSHHDKITVSVKLPASAPSPDTGLYHGVARVREGGVVKVVAAIVLRIT